jgi:hypothetical protein
MYDYLLLVQDSAVYDMPEEGENPNAFSYIHVATLDTGTVLNTVLTEDPTLVDGDTIVGKWDRGGSPLAPLDSETLGELLVMGNTPEGHIASPPDIHHFMGWTRRKYGSLDNPTHGDFPDGETPVKIRASWEKGKVKVEVVDYLESRDMLTRLAQYETQQDVIQVPFTLVNGIPTATLPQGNKPKEEELVEEEKAKTVVRIRGPQGEEEGRVAMHPKHKVREGLSWTYNQPPEPEIEEEVVV